MDGDLRVPCVRCGEAAYSNLMTLPKFATYRATPGLERYPEHERFAVWRQAHQHLLRADYSYTRQYQAYQAKITSVSALGPLACLPLALGGAVALVSHFLHWPTIYGVSVMIVGLVLSLGSVAYLWRLAARQQSFMNAHVATVLRQRTAEATVPQNQ